jgi:hypothetical protein
MRTTILIEASIGSLSQVTGPVEVSAAWHHDFEADSSDYFWVQGLFCC